MKKNWKGILLTAAVALAAEIIGKKFEIIGGSIIGIILGIIINNYFSISNDFVPGIKFTSKYILQLSVVILGFTLNLNSVREVGLSSFQVTIWTVLITLAASHFLGKLLSIHKDLATLIGVGTSICGGSAIAAVSSVIEPEEHDLAYAMSTIFLFNVIAAILFPVLGHLMNMTDNTFGLWAGTAINDTSSVVAAGYTFSRAAGNYATIVKLSRSILILPISLGYAAVKLFKSKKENNLQNKKIRFHNIFPWFILFFLLASFVETTVNFSPDTKHIFSETAKFLIIMALSGIGLSTNFKKMFSSGFKPIFLGFILWVLISVLSLAIQFFT